MQYLIPIILFEVPPSAAVRLKVIRKGKDKPKKHVAVQREIFIGK